MTKEESKRGEERNTGRIEDKIRGRKVGDRRRAKERTMEKEKGIKRIILWWWISGGGENESWRSGEGRRRRRERVSE